MYRLLRTLGLVLLLGAAANGYAHSGKARFHAIIDTDGAADDLRALCLMLGNREIEVLAVTTSEGALTPAEAAAKTAALLGSFHHEGVPVGAGRAVEAPAPPWRAHSEAVDWGDGTPARTGFPAANTLIARTIDEEEERIVFVALGALTNLDEVLQARPELAERIQRVVWYNTQAEPLAGPNYATDSLAARRVLASGVDVAIISANPECPIAVTPQLLDSLAAVPTRYARRIASTHRTEPLARLVGERHLQAWDDLVAVYLFAPELFRVQEVSPSVQACTLNGPDAAAQAEGVLMSILRGKPDSESRVFYGFPVAEGLYAEDVAPIVAQAIERHGPSEWRAAVLTNELHGHLGIYATIGVKMGIRAREYFNIGVDDIRVTSYAGLTPPVSCMNDGLQVGTGASVGHGLISVADEKPVRPEARFSFKGKTIRLRLKPAYAARIRDDVRQGVALYGDLTEPYWQYIRALALRYWLEFDRHAIFDLEVETDPATGSGCLSDNSAR
ncbi:nucleoside hydrolase [Alistipes sp.]|uniref:nucleoside hydrolase n=1 Tax=Alistipes sp. TaxID=1872444 RepID=UPI003AEF4BFF